MTQNEVMKIIAILEVSYPQHYSKLTKEQLQNQLMLWSELWSDTDVNLIANTVKSIINGDVSPFPPTIGQINNKAYELFAPKGLSEQEIVTKLKYAICNSGYYAQRMYDNLPSEIQVLCSPSQLRSWSQIDEKEVDTVVMSLATRGLQKRMVEKKNSEMLPNSVKIQISEITKSLKLENKDDEGDDEDE